MRNFFTLILFYLSINVTFLYAQYQDKGISGSLGYIYEDEKYEIDDVITLQKKFTQEYQLNYEGNIYNPNLLDYKLSGLIRFDDTKQQNGENSGRTDVRSKDFRVDANFIKNSDFPFRMYYSTTDRPISTVYANNTINSISERENYGLFGLVKLNNIKFDYEASKETSINNDSIILQEITTTKYAASIEYKTKKDNARLRYLHLGTDSEYYTADSTSSIIGENDTLDFSYNTNITDDLTFSSSLQYAEGTINDSTIMDARFDLNWRPKTNYYGSVDIAFDRVDYYLPNDLNVSSLEDVLIRTDTMDINQYFGYEPIKNLTFSEAVSFFSYEGNSLSGEITSLVLNANYRYINQLTSQRRMGLTTSLRNETRKIDRTSLTEDTSTTTNEYLLNTKLDISERFLSINSLLTSYIGYVGSRSSSLDERDEYSAGLSLTSTFGIFTNALNTSYNSSSYGNVLRYGDNINFTKQIGLNGNLNAGVGAEVLETTNDTRTLRSELYKAHLNFRYRFLRNVDFSTTAGVDKDLGYNTLRYSSKSSLSYRRGLSEMSISYDYNYLSASSNSLAIANTNETYASRRLLQAKFKRRF